MIHSTITNGRGKKYRASVDRDGCVAFVEHPRPPFGGETTMRVFRQHLTDDGLTTDGSNQDMRVDGSSTAQDFYIPASSTRDRYLSMLSFVIADAGQVLNEFGNTNNPLTNGCRLFYEDEFGEVDIHEALKTNFDFIRLCGGSPAFGDAANSFRASNVSGSSEGYIPTLNLRETFGFRWGVRLAVGSNQRLIMRIRDDATAVDQFDVIAYGFERLDV